MWCDLISVVDLSLFGYIVPAYNDVWLSYSTIVTVIGQYITQCMCWCVCICGIMYVCESTIPTLVLRSALLLHAVRRSSDACDGQGGGEDCSRSKEGAATSKPANGNEAPSGDEDSDDRCKCAANFSLNLNVSLCGSHSLWNARFLLQTLFDPCLHWSALRTGTVVRDTSSSGSRR